MGNAGLSVERIVEWGVFVGPFVGVLLAIIILWRGGITPALVWRHIWKIIAGDE